MYHQPLTVNYLAITLHAIHVPWHKIILNPPANIAGTLSSTWTGNQPSCIKRTFPPSPTKKIPIFFSIHIITISVILDMPNLFSFFFDFTCFSCICLFHELRLVSEMERTAYPFNALRRHQWDSRRKDNPLFFFYSLDVLFFLVGLLYDLCCVCPMLTGAYGYYHPLIEYSLLLLPPDRKSVV